LVIFGGLNTRYTEEIEKRTNIFKLIKLSFLTGIFMVGQQMLLEPIGLLSNLWEYSNSSGIYFGAPLLSFFSLFIETTFIILIYLMLEFLIDLGVFKFEKLKIFRPPIFGSNHFLIILTSLLPMIALLFHSLLYFFIINPPYLRLIAFFSMGLPILLGLNSLEFQKDERKNLAVIE